MLIYFVLYAIPSIIAFLTRNENIRNVLFITYIFILVLFIGLRYEVGTDWSVYSVAYEIAIYYSLWDYNFFEFAYSMLSWILRHQYLGIWSVNLFCSAIFCIGLYKYCKKQPIFWLALTSAIPYLVIVVSMGYTRQSAALGFVMWGLSMWKPGKFVQFSFFIMLAVLFHKTAVIMLGLGLLVDRKFINLRMILSLPVMFSVIYYITADIIADKWDFYTEQVNSQGAFIRVFMNFIPAVIFFLFINKFKKFDNYRLLFIFSMASVAAFVLIFIPNLTTIIDRSMLFFLPLQLSVYSTMSEIMSKGKVRAFFNIGVVSIYGIVLWVWLKYSIYSEFWIPYDWSISN